MKFVGKPNDYYDHQAHVWGVDGLIVYDRNAFWAADPPLFKNGDPIFNCREFKIDGEIHFCYQVNGRDHKFDRFLAVCGKLYPLVHADDKGQIYSANHAWIQPSGIRPELKWEIFRADYHTLVETLAGDRSPLGRTHFNRWYKNIQDIGVGDEIDSLEALSKMVHQPIFMISKITTSGMHSGHATTNYTVDPHYPVTSEMGLGLFISPDKLYQEVGYWLTNIINPSPDIMPMGKPPQTDVEKAVSHGFDKKISFRKRGD
jgi:hypothetical protein